LTSYSQGVHYNQENKEVFTVATNRQYDQEYKIQAVKLAKEIGQAKAARELGIPKNTLYTWIRANRLGNLDLGAGSQTPKSAMTLNEELITLRKQVKDQDKEIRRLKEENEFLEEASAFFAASRLKSAKMKG
jgi:transposase